MKNLFALLLAAALLLTLAACAGGNNEETTQVAEPTPATVEAASGSNDLALIASVKAQLVGSWRCSDNDSVTLTFCSNGTGSYLGLNGTERDFLYRVIASRRTDDNGGESAEQRLNVKYSNNAEEDIRIDFRENGEELVLQSVDSGAYDGLIDFDVWTKEE